jgi:hypothetical protein
VCGNPIDGTAYYLMVSTQRRFLPRTIRQAQFDAWRDLQAAMLRDRPRYASNILGGVSLLDRAKGVFAAKHGARKEEVEWFEAPEKDDNGGLRVKTRKGLKVGRVTPLYTLLVGDPESEENPPSKAAIFAEGGADYDKLVGVFLDEARDGGRVVAFRAPGAAPTATKSLRERAEDLPGGLRRDYSDAELDALFRVRGAFTRQDRSVGGRPAWMTDPTPSDLDLLAKGKVRGKVKKQARIEEKAQEKGVAVRRPPVGAFVHNRSDGVREWFLVRQYKGIDAERLKELNPYLRNSHRIPFKDRGQNEPPEVIHTTLADVVIGAFGTDARSALALIQSGNVRVSKGGRRRMGGPQFDPSLSLRSGDTVTIINKEKATSPFFSFVYEGAAVPDEDSLAVCTPQQRGSMQGAAQVFRTLRSSLASAARTLAGFTDPERALDRFRPAREGGRVKAVVRVDPGIVEERMAGLTRAIDRVDSWYEVSKAQGDVPGPASRILADLSVIDTPPMQSVVAGLPGTEGTDPQPGLPALLQRSKGRERVLLELYNWWAGGKAPGTILKRRFERVATKLPSAVPERERYTEALRPAEGKRIEYDPGRAGDIDWTVDVLRSAQKELLDREIKARVGASRDAAEAVKAIKYRAGQAWKEAKAGVAPIVAQIANREFFEADSYEQDGIIRRIRDGRSEYTKAADPNLAAAIEDYRKVVYGIEETERRLIAKVLDPIRKQAESEINPLFANLALWAGYYYYLGGYKLNGPINPNPLPGKTLGSGRLEVAIDRMARFAGRNETEFKASSSNLIESLQQGLASRQGYPASKRYVERQIRSGFVFVRPRVRDPFREVTLTKEGRVVYADDGKPATVRKGTRIMVSESRRGGSQLAGANYHVYKTYNPILFKMALHDWGSREGRELATALEAGADTLLGLDSLGSYGALVRLVQEAAFANGDPEDVNAAVADQMGTLLGPAVAALQGRNPGLVARNSKGEFAAAVLTWDMNWTPDDAESWWSALIEDPMPTMQSLKAEVRPTVNMYGTFGGATLAKFRAGGTFDLASGPGSRVFKEVRAGKRRIGGAGEKTSEMEVAKKLARKLMGLRSSHDLPKKITVGHRGNFGDAVAQFQRKEGLPVTGFVDARTADKLEQALVKRHRDRQPKPLSFPRDEQYEYRASSLEAKMERVRDQYQTMMRRIGSAMRDVGKNLGEK